MMILRKKRMKRAGLMDLPLYCRKIGGSRVVMYQQGSQEEEDLVRKTKIK